MLNIYQTTEQDIEDARKILAGSKLNSAPRIIDWSIWIRAIQCLESNGFSETDITWDVPMDPNIYKQLKVQSGSNQVFYVI
jgi:hypothetical protein